MFQSSALYYCQMNTMISGSRSYRSGSPPCWIWRIGLVIPSASYWLPGRYIVPQWLMCSPGFPLSLALCQIPLMSPSSTQQLSLTVLRASQRRYVGDPTTFIRREKRVEEGISPGSSGRFVRTPPGKYVSNLQAFGSAEACHKQYKICSNPTNAKTD